MAYHAGWGNPMTELMGKQKRECHGCEHKCTEKAFGIEINYCKIGRTKMFKCDNYKELPTRKKDK